MLNTNARLERPRSCPPCLDNVLKDLRIQSFWEAPIRIKYEGKAIVKSCSSVNLRSCTELDLRLTSMERLESYSALSF
jgi:hypothetical protein